MDLLMLLLTYLFSRLFIYGLKKYIKSVNLYFVANGLSLLVSAIVWALWNNRNPFTWIDLSLILWLCIPQSVWLILDLYRKYKNKKK